MNNALKSVVSALVLAAGAVASDPGLGQETLKIGIMGTLSGPGASSGFAVQRGVQIAIDEVNAAGGLSVGGKTYKLTSIPYDTQLNAGQAKIVADRLVH